MIRPNIALYGRSGSGKSTIAQYLKAEYGYEHVSPGHICRRICQELFNSEDRSILNAFNDAVRKIDSDVWLRNATRHARGQSWIVFDSMRFQEDWIYLKAKGFVMWKLE